MSDIVIIGGGIAGISAAAHVAPHASTTLIEAESSTGYHASGRSAAMYLCDYGNSTVRALNHASADTLHATQVLKKRGMLIPGAADQHDQFIQDCNDENLSQITVSEAQDLCPILNADHCTMAGYRPDAYDLDTDLLMQTYLRQARKADAEIVTNTRVDQITRTANGWHIRAGEVEFNAKLLINAAGAWVDHIAALAGVAPLGFTPYRRSIARMPAPGGRDVTNWPFMLGVGESWFAKPDAGKWLVSPADEDPMEPFDAYADDMVLAEGIARYSDMVTEPVTRVETSWAGLRTFAPDRTLVVGHDAREPEFFWLAGQGGYGFQSAPAAAQLVGDLVGGGETLLDAPTIAALSPHRFA